MEFSNWQPIIILEIIALVLHPIQRKGFYSLPVIDNLKFYIKTHFQMVYAILESKDLKFKYIWQK